MLTTLDRLPWIQSSELFHGQMAPIWRQNSSTKRSPFTRNPTVWRRPLQLGIPSQTDHCGLEQRRVTTVDHLMSVWRRRLRRVHSAVSDVSSAVERDIEPNA